MTAETTYLKAEDFLAAIVGEEEDVVLPIGTVRIRPLTAVEAARLSQMQLDPGELAVRAVAMALVQPKLDSAQVARLQEGTAGALIPLVQRVMALAGLSGGDTLEDFPGGGS
jgi:hypothetical protein